jgi:hypothetical protein
VLDDSSPEEASVPPGRHTASSPQAAIAVAVDPLCRAISAGIVEQCGVEGHVEAGDDDDES